MPRPFYLPLVEPGVLFSLKATRKPAHSGTLCAGFAFVGSRRPILRVGGADGPLDLGQVGQNVLTEEGQVGLLPPDIDPVAGVHPSGGGDERRHESGLAVLPGAQVDGLPVRGGDDRGQGQIQRPGQGGGSSPRARARFSSRCCGSTKRTVSSESVFRATPCGR